MIRQNLVYNLYWLYIGEIIIEVVGIGLPRRRTCGSPSDDSDVEQVVVNRNHHPHLLVEQERNARIRLTLNYKLVPGKEDFDPKNLIAQTSIYNNYSLINKE